VLEGELRRLHFIFSGKYPKISMMLLTSQDPDNSFVHEFFHVRLHNIGLQPCSGCLLDFRDEFVGCFGCIEKPLNNEFP
jgi:hypothetical protein